MKDQGLQIAWHGKNAHDELGPFLGGPCAKRFKNKAAWSVHMFHVHKRTNPLRSLCQGTICLRCSRDYWTPTRLFHHLKYSADCAEYMKRAIVPSDPSPGINSRFYNRNEGPILAPPMEVSTVGPDLRNAAPADPEHGLSWELIDKLSLWIEGDFTPFADIPQFSTPWPLVNEIKQLLCSLPLDYEQIQQTFQAFAKDNQHFLSDDCPPAHLHAIHQALDTVSWLLSPSWLVPTAERPSQLSRTEAFFWLEELTDEQLRDIPPSSDIVDPPLVFVERYVVHFFSGHRRNGDFAILSTGFGAT